MAYWGAPWSKLLLLLVCTLGWASAHMYGQRSTKTGVSSSRQLMCHDCSGADCLRLISKGWGGRCRTRKGLPKCFVRKDPNGLVYRGCADHSIWPSDLALDYNGCQTQRYGDWSEKKVIWCFCDYGYCNVNITVVTQRYGVRPAKAKPQTMQQPIRTTNHYQPYVPRYKPEPKPYRPGYTWYRPDANRHAYHAQQTTAKRRPQQKRVMFYKPLGYPDSQYVEPIDNIPTQPLQQSVNKQPWYDIRQPAKNQAWIPPAELMAPRFVEYTTPKPTQATQRMVFTTHQPIERAPTPVPSMAQDLEAFETSKPEGKIGKEAPNEINRGFDLSNIPDWLWEKIKPQLGEEEDIKPLKDRHTCADMGCAHECIVKEGHPFCTCPLGYMLMKDGLTCEDTNECDIRNGDCSHDCFNTVGSYKCACPTGYILDINQKTCIDYNECSTANCEHDCHNIAGSYECICRPGYIINADGKTCDDVNECNTNENICDHFCVNIPGSFTCDCNHGYHLDTNKIGCRDTNECRVENGGCEHRCQNTAGNHECYCNRGYILNVDGKTCDDVDECRVDNGGCDHFCFNEAATYECQCNNGYTLDTDKRTCIDLNECLQDNGGCESICDNVKGSFRCRCREGASLNVDKRSCDAVDKCSQSNGGCEHVCSTTASGARCSCHQGYMLRPDGRTCADINECNQAKGGCDQLCENTIGSYLCRCRMGYTLNVDGITCDDIDECAREVDGCSQQCRNTPGSYQCRCTAGYQLTQGGRLCEDINECRTDNGGCGQNCTNVAGSHRCSCDGIIYRLHADGKRCIGTCPSDFTKNERLSSCYKIFTPQGQDEATAKYSQDVASAQKHCQSLHPLGGLVSIQTDDEKRYLSTLLKREPQMLEGWQGWWTSGSYHSGLNLFQWSDGTYISNDSPHWGFRKTPVTDTCVWVLQISVYNQTWGNYDCYTKSGHICEVQLDRK